MMLTLVPMLSHDQKSHCTTFQPLWPKECNGAIDTAISIMWHQCQLHYITNEVMLVCHFDCVHLRNAMVQLMILSASHDSSSSVNGITWPTMSCCTSFQLFWPKEYKVPLMTQSASHDANAITWPISSCCTSCHCLDLRNAVVSLPILLVSHDINASANGIIWPQKVLFFVITVGLM